MRQFEKLLVEAQTSEGALARDMMLEVKDAVQNYITWKMVEASRAALERELVAQQQLELKSCLRCSHQKSERKDIKIPELY